MAFDTETLRATGPAFDVTEAQMATVDSTPQSFGLSEDGTLVYVPVGLYETFSTEGYHHLVWVDMQGGEETWLLPGISPEDPHITLTGERRSVVIDNEADQQLWILDPSGNRGPRRITFEGVDFTTATWGKDGRTLYYSGLLDGVWQLLRRDTRGTGAARVIVRYDSAGWEAWSGFDPTDYSGRMKATLGMSPRADGGGWDLLIVSDENPGEVRGVFSADHNTLNPALSPDEAWLAYQTDQLGGYEIVVTTFPGLEGRWQISPKGGTDPVWAPDGSAIYYRDEVNIVAVDLDTEDGFTFSAPRTLFRDTFEKQIRKSYDIDPSGEKFLFMRQAFLQDGQITQLIVVENWLEVLMEKARAAGALD